MGVAWDKGLIDYKPRKCMENMSGCLCTKYMVRIIHLICAILSYKLTHSVSDKFVSTVAITIILLVGNSTKYTINWMVIYREDLQS